MNLQDIPITDLIPQRPPFVMVDKLLSCDQVNALSEFTICPDNIFLDNQLLSPAGIIENMAQACAARMGCVNRMHNKPIKIGFIGDIRDCKIMRQPRCHEVLHTHVQIIEEVFNLTLANVISKVGDEVIASARMKIALRD